MFQRFMADQFATLNSKFERTVVGFGLFHTNDLAKSSYMVIGFKTESAKDAFRSQFESGKPFLMFDAAMIRRQIIPGLPDDAIRMGFLGIGMPPIEFGA